MSKRVNDAIAYRQKRKEISPDPFREENGYSWDYVMVFKIYERYMTLTCPSIFLTFEFQSDEILTGDQMKYNLKFILSELAASGLQIRLFYSAQVYK